MKSEMILLLLLICSSSLIVCNSIIDGTTEVVKYLPRVDFYSRILTASDDDNIDDETVRCRLLYGHRRFLDHSSSSIIQAMIPPPLLYSQPGSGNTWTRLMIEYATGIYSGSFYNDETLLKVFPGELKCNCSESIIKAHPVHFRYNFLFRANESNLDKPVSHKCARQGHIHNFKRMILLVRHPLEAIWAEFLRWSQDSHVGRFPRSKFDFSKFFSFATSLSHSYNHFYTIDLVRARKDLAPKDFMKVRYEDFRNESIQLDQLRSVLKFLDLEARCPSYNQTKGYTKEDEYDRVKCAFKLGDNRHIHRPQVSHNETVEYATIADGFFATPEARSLLCQVLRSLHVCLIAEGYSTEEYQLSVGENKEIIYFDRFCPKRKIISYRKS